MRAIMVAGCLTLQLLGTVHLALVEHQLCAEHGEAIDVAESASHAAEPGQRAELNGSSAAESEHDRSQQQHDHCPIDDHRHAHALSILSADWADFAVSTAIAEPHVSCVRLSTRALRLLAPKTSPPA